MVKTESPNEKDEKSEKEKNESPSSLPSLPIEIIEMIEKWYQSPTKNVNVSQNLILAQQQLRN